MIFPEAAAISVCSSRVSILFLSSIFCWFNSSSLSSRLCLNLRAAAFVINAALSASALMQAEDVEDTPERELLLDLGLEVWDTLSVGLISSLSRSDLSYFVMSLF